MNIILLSGGSGKRLWPLSNDVRSKQFIKIFKDDQGNYESMIQRIYRQIKNVDPQASITIATAKSQISSIRNQLRDKVNISVEPCRRNTFPAIALACAYLNEIQNVPEEEIVVVCPVDPYVDESYFRAVCELGMQAAKGEANLVLMGIVPTCASEKYGYIIPCENTAVSTVKTFKEKPSEQIAQEYIRQGALWNGGVFAFRLRYMLQKAHELIEFTGYSDLFERYDRLNSISIDYAVVEREPHLQVVRYNGTWDDLGTWDSLTAAMEETVVGKAIVGEECRNVHVVNELAVPVVALGIKDIVISASPEGILVSDKAHSGKIKPIAECVDQQIMFAEKSWGDFRVLDVDRSSMTIKLKIYAGRHMSYHNHRNRDEVWVVVEGRGRALVDGEWSALEKGSVVSMKAGQYHTIFAESEMQLIEIQMGDEISVEDKKKDPR